MSSSDDSREDGSSFVRGGSCSFLSFSVIVNGFGRLARSAHGDGLVVWYGFWGNIL